MNHLPKTLAAVRGELSHGEIASVLNTEVPVALVPMEPYLERGGWPEFDKFEIRGIRRHPDASELLLTLHFIEHTPASCPSSSKPETRIAYLKARIDHETATAALSDDSE